MTFRNRPHPVCYGNGGFADTRVEGPERLADRDRGIMAGNSRSRELGDELERLKLASGRSYESIGRKVHLSKSAVHRYCTGANAPQEFAVVERIASACGASRDDMILLHRLWLRATDSANEVADDEAPAEAVHSPEPPKPLTPMAPRPGRRVRTRRLTALAVVNAVLAVILVSSTTGTHLAATAPDRSVDQRLTGPAWTLPPAPVPSALFGVTINSATGAMPAFRVGAVRFWDGGTRWSEIQRHRGEFDWAVLDRLVSGAERAGVPPLFVFGGTPKWAAPDGPVAPYPDATAAPPTDLSDWDLFVRTLVDRYRGRIEAYELWVLANDRKFYAGSVETLIEMSRRAGDIIRSSDPDATVVCPGMGELWTSEGVAFLRRFAELGGYDHCDVAGIKLFKRQASDPPETMVDLTASIDRVMHRAGVHPRLWSTGTAYSIALQEPLDEATARNHAVRFFLVGIYARKVNLERMYFYNWGGTRIPIVLQPVGGVPTSAALAVEQLQRWLHHAHSRACGHGAPANLPDNVWQCEFTVTEPGQTYDATIRWTDEGTATLTAGPRSQELRHLDGRVEKVRSGDTITVTEEPVLIAASTDPRR
ncbi:helix-turn-helix domain-containing protein [Actinosynnema sp. NPDC002837]